MKHESDLLRRIFDMEIDNIKQERELFKHIAIVAAAIVGMFIFNGEFEVSGLTKFGLIGLVTVIILSVLLLFIIIRLERKRTLLLMTAVQRAEDIKSDFLKKTLLALSNKELLSEVKEKIKGGNMEELMEIASSTFSNIYIQAQTEDIKINAINKELEYKKIALVFTVSSWFCIVLFLVSIILILIDIIW